MVHRTTTIVTTTTTMIIFTILHFPRIGRVSSSCSSFPWYRMTHFQTINWGVLAWNNTCGLKLQKQFSFFHRILSNAGHSRSLCHSSGSVYSNLKLLLLFWFVLICFGSHATKKLSVNINTSLVACISIRLHNTVHIVPIPM